MRHSVSCAPGILTRTTFLLAVLSGVAIVGNWVLLFASYSRASIAIGTAVYNVQPFMLVGLAALFLNEKITLQKLFWLGISFLGMLAIVSAHGEQGEGGNDYLMGIALALGGCISVRDCRADHQTPDRYTTASDCVDPGLHRRAVARALCAFLGDTANPQCLGQPGDTGHRAYRFDVCVALRRDSKKLPTALTGALSFIYPIAAIFVDWFAFGHRLEPLQWIGVAAILLAAAGMQQGWGLKLRRVAAQ